MGKYRSAQLWVLIVRYGAGSEKRNIENITSRREGLDGRDYIPASPFAQQWELKISICQDSTVEAKPSKSQEFKC